MRRPGRERHAEVGARRGDLYDLDSPAVSDHELPRNGQAQTAAADSTAMDVLALIEPIENPLAILERNSRTRVSYVKHHLDPLSSQRQRNHTLIRRVFDRIGDQRSEERRVGK